jgi:hypothetical protein
MRRVPHSATDNNLKAALLDAALAFYSRGLSIIPCRRKKAAVKWEPFQERRPSAEQLSDGFHRPGITGLAVIHGVVSGGLVIRDWDRGAAYQDWALRHPDLARILPTVKTHRGMHVYAIAPKGFARLPDGEYRGDSGHYTLLPPSLHPDGGSYSWVVPLPDGDIPTVDDPVTAGLVPDGVSILVESAVRSTHASSEHTQAHSSYSLHVSDSSIIETAIVATLPNGAGQRNRRLFDMARRLKAIIPTASMAELEPIVRAWHTRALPVIRTKDWLVTWVDFRIAWTRIRHPAGVTMAHIAEAARADTPDNADPISRLAALCRALQAHHGPGRAWPLSCRRAGAEIGVSHDTAARLLKLLCAERIIELVKPDGGKGSRRAAEYRYLPTE